MRRAIACVAIVLAAAFGAVACGDDDDDGQSEAEAQLCTSLEGFGAAVQQVEGVQLGDPSANASNISITRVKATWSGVQAAAEDVTDADASALGTAVDNLESAVEDLPGGQTVAQVKTQLEPQIAAVNSALEEMRNGVQCQ